MSQVIWDYVEPLLGPKEEWEPAVVGSAVSFAIHVWNTVIMERRHHDPVGALLVGQMANALPREQRAGYLEQIEMMRQRKLESFGGDDRLILEHTLDYRDGEFHLQVMSRDPDRG